MGTKAKDKERKKINNYTVGEEIANAVSHGVGAGLGIAGTVVAIVTAARHANAMTVVSVSLYGASLIILYLISTLYHALTAYGGKKVFQILDHCTIFLLIFGTYIPVCLSLIRGAAGWVLFGIIAGCAVLGIVFNAIDMKRWKTISLVLYVVMGWAVVFSGKIVLEKIPKEGLIYLLGGGLAYTFGILFYRMKRRKYFHFIWHLFVLAGSILHYFFILFYCCYR
jgi:hemolysin III